MVFYMCLDQTCFLSLSASQIYFAVKAYLHEFNSMLRQWSFNWSTYMCVRWKSLLWTAADVVLKCSLKSFQFVNLFFLTFPGLYSLLSAHCFFFARLFRTVIVCGILLHTNGMDTCNRATIRYVFSELHWQYSLSHG